MNSLIGPDSTWLLWTIILAGVALSIWLEQTFRWAAKISGPVLALCIAMALANARVMPAESPVYDVVQNDLVPLALPLLLFRANVFEIIRSTGWLFVAFHLASAGTVAGAFTAAGLLHRSVADTPEVAAIMTGSYIGGGVNFFTIARSYEISKNVTGPLLVADNFIMAGVLMALLLMYQSRVIRRWYPHPHAADAADSRALALEHWKAKPIALLDIALALAVAVGVVALAGLSSQWLQHWIVSVPHSTSRTGFLAKSLDVLTNRFVHLTFWSTVLATVGSRWLKKINGAEEFGGYLLYVFLFVIGLPADLWLVFSQVPLMFVFCLIMAAMNIVVTFLLGRVLKIDLEHLILAINASLGGPPTAAAMAVSMGWSKLVLPALLVGIWGYTIGTLVGLAVGEILRHWL